MFEYTIIRNFIGEEEADELNSKFRDFSMKYPELCRGDVYVPNTPSRYNFQPHVSLLANKTAKVSSYLKEKVIPTYSYCRRYKRGDVLPKHVDRPECEVSLTVHLDSDREWSIFLQTKDGVEEVILCPGDALMYSGCDVPHWRDAYEGEYYNQVFLHYVREDGPFGDRFFDHKSSDTSLKKFISVYDHILTHEQCDEIIAECEKHKWKEMLTVGNVDLNERHQARRCWGQALVKDDSENSKQLDTVVYNAVNTAVTAYCRSNPQVWIKDDTGYQVLKYNNGDYYEVHTDHCATIPRTLSCSIALNDDYEGGKFVFFGTDSYKLKKGSAIIFPSNFVYPHEITKVTEGIRYSIITWLI